MAAVNLESQAQAKGVRCPNRLNISYADDYQNSRL